MKEVSDLERVARIMDEQGVPEEGRHLVVSGPLYARLVWLRLPFWRRWWVMLFRGGYGRWRDRFIADSVRGGFGCLIPAPVWATITLEEFQAAYRTGDSLEPDELWQPVCCRDLRWLVAELERAGAVRDQMADAAYAVKAKYDALRQRIADREASDG